MKLFVLPLSPRAFKVIALKNHLGLDREMQVVDLGMGDQLTPRVHRDEPEQEDAGARGRRLRALGIERNPLLPRLEEAAERAVAVRRKGQADVLRWLAWESAHWDAESVGMVGRQRRWRSEPRRR
jgi:glutathione S-transferase